MEWFQGNKDQEDSSDFPIHLSNESKEFKHALCCFLKGSQY